MRRRTAAIGLASLGIALLLPAPAAFAGGCGTVTEGTVPAGARAVVDLRSLCFGPSILRVAPGQTVTFVNQDPFRHSVLGAGLGWGRAALGPGRSFAVTFDRSGVYPFSCYLHPGMTGVVVVGDGLGPGPVAASAVATAAATSTGGTTTRTSTTRRADSSTPASGRPLTGWLIVGLAGLLVGAAGSRLAGRLGRSAEREKGLAAAHTNDA